MYQDPTQYFLNDETECIKLIEEKIQEVVRLNPGVTTQSVLNRIARKFYTIPEQIKDDFTTALCNLITKDQSIEVCGFKEPKDKPFESQLVAKQLSIF
jgi:hypothetical protein